MKIKIETTLELKDRDLEAMRLFYEEMGDGEETFRDFVKTFAAVWAHAFVDKTANNYAPYTMADLHSDGLGGYTLGGYNG